MVRACLAVMFAVCVRVYLAVAILAVVGVIICVLAIVGPVVCVVEKLRGILVRGRTTALLGTD